MNQKEMLFAFEEKYPFLYDICVNGVPVYTCYRDGILSRLQGMQKGAGLPAVKSRVLPKRIFDSFLKFYRFRKKQTLIFTSSVYRRDAGRNLAAEYLLEKYPDGVIFEWPSRVDAYDSAYFADPQIEKYCPMEWYILLYKLYLKLSRKKYRKWAEECTAQLQAGFAEKQPETEEEKQAVAYLLAELPETYAATACSQELFRRLFKGYKNVRYAIDFWGSARENIIPVLPGKPESIELQHGIITSYHPGYIYPDFAREGKTDFFKRTLLVYGQKTKTQLVEGSIFTAEQVQVIGNPRIKKYKTSIGAKAAERKLLLFASQPYEQDGLTTGYYDLVIRFLKEVEKLLVEDPLWANYRLGIKLHPRENNAVVEMYQKAFPNATVYDNASQLYTLLCESFVQMTMTSTSLYEGAEFDTPTVITYLQGKDPERIFGFPVWTAYSPEQLIPLLQKLQEKEEYGKYLQYLKEQSLQYN